MQIQPYVIFDGRCEEAIEFYKKVFGAEVNMLMRNNESPDPHSPGMLPPGSERKIMHANLRIGDSVVLMSDGHCGGSPKFEGFTLSVVLKLVADSERIFNALTEGGQVLMPLTKTFFSLSFGMAADKFGVHWMIYVTQ
jgi:PhnB protein